MSNDPSDKALYGWMHRGQQRPDFALQPKQGQESVWDYPRPPSLEIDSRMIVIRHRKRIIAQTRRAYRILETASPPTFYLHPEDIDHSLLVENSHSSFCEWKGQASYFDFADGYNKLRDVAWCYPYPHSDYKAIANYISFYPSKVDCFIDDIKVTAQSGDFYGGWITPEIVGPFKGDPGTEAW